MTQTSQEEVPLLVQGRTWEDMPTGSAFRTAKRTITETDLVTFLHVSGINEPLFYDAGHAAGAGYSGRLVPGALVYVVAEGLILQTNVLHGTGLAFMSMEYSIKAPTFVGDTIHVVVTRVEPGRPWRRAHPVRDRQPARRRGRVLHPRPAHPGPGLRRVRSSR